MNMEGEGLVDGPAQIPVRSYIQRQRNKEFMEEFVVGEVHVAGTNNESGGIYLLIFDIT
jgi:hypothetical protein